MKYDITIRDVEQHELQGLIARINSTTVGEAFNNAAIAAPVQVAPVNVAPAPYTPPAPIAPAEETDEGVSQADVSGQVDAEGLQWDDRIHSSNKKRTAKNVWQRRRGISELDYTRIRGEILGGVAAPVAPINVAPVPYAPPAPDAAYVPAPVPYAPQPVAPINVAPVPYAPPAPVAPVAPVQAAPNTISTLLVRIQQAVTVGKIKQDYIQSLVARVNQHLQLNCAGVTDFAVNQQAIDVAHHFMNADGN